MRPWVLTLLYPPLYAVVYDGQTISESESSSKDGVLGRVGDQNREPSWLPLPIPLGSRTDITVLS